MAGPVGSKTKRVGGGSGGTVPAKKKDGYAAGPIPRSMIGTKSGRTNHRPYSGPEVVEGKFP